MYKYYGFFLLTMTVSTTSGLYGQTTIFNFNTIPAWTSTYYVSQDAVWNNPTGGAGGISSNYLQATTNPWGTGIRAITVKVPAFTQIEVKGYMRGAMIPFPYSASLACISGYANAYDFYLSPGSWTDINTFSNMGVNGNSSMWTSYHVMINSGVDTCITIAFSMSASATIDASFDDVTITPLSPLPVSLIEFDATNTNKGNIIKWETASEENNDHFDLERSMDGKDFEKISSENGQGNSQSLVSYEYLDKSIITGECFYRLKQVDYNGKFIYSPIAKVKQQTGISNTLKAWPNPFIGGFHWEYNPVDNKKYTIRMNDLSGKEVYSEVVSGALLAGECKVRDDLPHGMYILSIGNDASSPTEMIVEH